MTEPATSSQDRKPRANPPILTWLAIVACIGVFLGLQAANDFHNEDTLRKWGAFSGRDVWKGAYWGLITCAFVHFQIWHIAGNLYWLWHLGKRMERAIGPVYYAVFFCAAAVVSSGFELALSDQTGIGASGVLFGMFGFMWLTRHRYPAFGQVLNTQTIRLMLGWLVLCYALTQLHVLNIGNAAHTSGLLFGCAVAGAFVGWRMNRWRKTGRAIACAGVVTMIALAVTPLFWAPWSVAWLSVGAERAIAAQHHEEAIAIYTKIIDRKPDAAWAYFNRGVARAHLGDNVNATQDFKTATKLDPSLESRLSGSK